MGGMKSVKNALIYFSKVVVGFVFSISLLGLIAFVVGFFYQEMSVEYLERNSIPLMALTLSVLFLAYPTWKWRKVAFDAFSFMLPF
jgi:uncharacterized membrane protein YoaK (UPF0700 family)